MSIFGVEQVLWDISRNAALAESYRVNPAEFFAQYRVDPEEIEAIQRLDVFALSQRGVNPMLLMQSWNTLIGPDEIGEYLARMNGGTNDKDKSHG